MGDNINQLINPFQFSNIEVRTAVGEDGEVWFCAKDVFEVLGITWKGNAGSLKNTPEKWKGVCYCQTSGGGKELVFLSEAAVYQTAFTSRKPEAMAFTEWVCGEVLPAIRKQGYFGKVSASQRLAYSRQISAIAERLTKTTDALVYTFLIDELRDLCNLIGRPAPDINLLGKDYRQLDLDI